MPKANPRNGFAEPQWFEEFKAAYSSGKTQAFILHLNVKDYAVPGIRLTAYLCKKLASRDIIAVYNRAEGITFPLPSMRERFMQTLGLQTKADPALAALGLASGQPQADLPKAPASALPLLERLLKSDCKATVIVEYAETLLPAADIATMSPDDRTILVTLARWGIDKGIEASGNFAFLATDNLASLHPTLRSASNGYMALEIPLPAREARRQFVEWYLEANPLGCEMDTAQLANATAGLSLVHIENIFLQAALDGRLTWPLVRREKSAIVETEYAGLLEVLDPTGGFAVVGGMEPLKEWARREVIAPVREGRAQDAPQGVLLVGPPGTGKTFFVKALAGEIGFNAVALNLENILGGIVGTSERNLARALSVVKSLSPVLVFMDELDQSDVSSRGTGSGNPVAKNLFNMMLRFLSDPTNRGKVVFCGASNRPDLIDPAFMRFGRVDAIIPVLLPESDDRACIAATSAAAQGAGLEDGVAELIAAQTDKYSGADVAAVIGKARRLAGRERRLRINTADAETALRLICPATVKNADYYTMLAIDACNDAELLPPRYAGLLADRAALKDQIRAASPDTTRGKREL